MPRPNANPSIEEKGLSTHVDRYFAERNSTIRWNDVEKVLKRVIRSSHYHITTAKEDLDNIPSKQTLFKWKRIYQRKQDA